jgi:hypothetical protein
MGAALITGHTMIPGAPTQAIGHEHTKPLVIPPPGSPRPEGTDAHAQTMQPEEAMPSIATVVAVARALAGPSTPTPAAAGGGGRRPATLAGILAGVLSSIATNAGFWGAHEQYGSAEDVARLDAQDQETKALREDVKGINARLGTQEQETKALRDDVKGMREDVKETRTAIGDVLDVLQGIADGGKESDPLGIKQIRRRIHE